MSYLRHINLLKAFPGARMSGTYIVESSTELKRGTSKAGRPYVVYELQLGDGSRVEFAQSPNKPPPSIGEEIEGTVSEQYGKLSLRRERIQASNGAGGTGTGGYERNPDVQKSIVRQHSQQMALMWCQVTAILDKTSELTIGQVKRITDWFQGDAEGKEQGPFVP